MDGSLRILIKKDRQQAEFWVGGSPMPLPEILAALERSGQPLVHVRTVENGQLLLSCYLPFVDRAAFQARLLRAAKAKV